MSVDVDGTRSTLPDVAALFRSAEIEPLTKGVEKSDARLQIQVVPHAIHVSCERDLAPPPRRKEQPEPGLVRARRVTLRSDHFLSAFPTVSDGETGLPQVYIGGIRPFLPTLIWLAVNEPSAAAIGKKITCAPGCNSAMVPGA